MKQSVRRRALGATLAAFALGASLGGLSPVLAYGTCASTKVELDTASYPHLSVYDRNGDGIVCAWSSGAHGNTKFGDNRSK